MIIANILKDSKYKLEQFPKEDIAEFANEASNAFSKA